MLLSWLRHQNTILIHNCFILISKVKLHLQQSLSPITRLSIMSTQIKLGHCHSITQRALAGENLSRLQPDHILRSEILFDSFSLANHQEKKRSLILPSGTHSVGFYLHGVDSDGEGRVIPVHFILLAALLVSHGALVCSSDAEHTQDYHKHQEANTHHNDNGGSAGNHCDEANAKKKKKNHKMTG